MLSGTLEATAPMVQFLPRLRLHAPDCPLRPHQAETKVVICVFLLSGVVGVENHVSGPFSRLEAGSASWSVLLAKGKPQN